jgi:sigma-E factor negative regulatory protein RseA
MKSPPIHLQPEDLSALSDGEADAATAAAITAAWRDDAPLRARWHRYQLIGDVLRSEDLAQTPAADAAFLSALRERLASEPVVLAPTIVTPSGEPRLLEPTRRRWMGAGAIAAGFVAVAGAVFVLRPATEAPSAQLALQQPAVAPQVLAAAEPEPQATAANSVLVHDAGLDRYLAAHQQFGGNSALAVPSGFMRNATYEGPSR